MSNGTDETTELVTTWLDWARERSVGDVIDPETLETIVVDLAESDEVLRTNESTFAEVWEWLHDEFEREERTVRDVLGPELSEKIVEYARENEPSEEAARILFRNEAAEAMFGNILYDGITEFLSRVDIINTILDKIPLIGGIKGKIQDNFPEGVQGLAEGRVKQFLGNFSGAAAEKAMNFVLSPEHEGDLAEVQANLAEYLIDQPINSYVLDPEKSREWRQAAWAGLKQHLTDPDEILPRLQRLYDEYEQRSVDEFVPETLPDSVRNLMAGTVDRFLRDEDLADWFDRYYNG